MLVINIPADGLFLAIQNHADGDFSREKCENIINEYLGRFLENEPDMIFLNVCYRRSLTPSEVFDSYLYNIETDEEGFPVKNQEKEYSPETKTVSKYFATFFVCARELLKSGIDIYEIAINRIRQTSCKVFLSVRMNDAHYPENPAINSSFALKNGCQYTINKDGVYLDFSSVAVQNYYYSYIEELLEKYKVDGIEIDWLRYPTVLPAEKRSEYHILNDYMKRIRSLIDKYNESALIAVRMLPTEEENLWCGFDVCEWLSGGCADMVTIENFYVPTNYELPVASWRKSIEKRNVSKRPYSLLCGSDWGVSCVARYNIAMNPALVRGFADASFTEGADGVYLFNFFEENDTSSFEFSEDAQGKLSNCFSQRVKAAKEWEKLPRRYVHIGNSNGRYPISLQKNYTFVKTVKSHYDRLRCVIGYDKDVSLNVYMNGCLAESFKKEEVSRGFEYISGEEIGKGHDFIYAVSQAAPVVYSAFLPQNVFLKGELEIKIENVASEEVKLLWLEIVCE